MKKPTSIPLSFFFRRISFCVSNQKAIFNRRCNNATERKRCQKQKKEEEGKVGVGGVWMCPE